MKQIVGSKNLYIISKYDPDVVLKKLYLGQLVVIGDECFRYKKSWILIGPGWLFVDMETGEVLYETTKSEPAII